MQPILSYQGKDMKIQLLASIKSLLNFFQGRPRLKKAIAETYSKSFGRTLNPDTEVTITTGANEGASLLHASIGEHF
jgi:aspartate/methionine/tyrosine aminotransferase